MRHQITASDIAGHEFTVQAAGSHGYGESKTFEISVMGKRILYVVKSHGELVLKTPSLTNAVEAYNNVPSP